MAAVSSELVDVSKSVSQFSADLYQKCAESSNGNIILSPYSVAVALALVSEGAKGKTFDELKKCLHLSGDKLAIADQFSLLSNAIACNTSNYTLNIANKVYVQEGKVIKSEFNEIATKKFLSEVQTLDFGQSVESAHSINTWVEKKTNDKIKNLIKPDLLTVDTRLVLVNAIYFKGKWEHQFDPRATQKGPFYLNNENSVEVDFMYIKEHFKYGQLEDLDASAIELKYTGSDISFLIILPNQRNGLNELEEKLKNKDLSKISESLYRTEVEVTIPKFKVEFEISLKSILQKLGVTDLFSDNANLDDLLTSSEQLKVDEVIHKAFIDVNEEGAEAAAATAAIMRKKRCAPTIFAADQPFFYAILSNSDHSLPLFCGSIRTFDSVVIAHDEL